MCGHTLPPHIYGTGIKVAQRRTESKHSTCRTGIGTCGAADGFALSVARGSPTGDVAVEEIAENLATGGKNRWRGMEP